MSSDKPFGPGFVLPPASGQYPQAGPPSQQHPMLHQPSNHPVYPNQPPPSYPGYNNQPFPGAVHQQQPAQASFITGDWYRNPNIHDYLLNATMFRVKQKTELLEILSGWETANRYSITDQNGTKILYAAEVQDCCKQNLCGACRSFEINVKDVGGSDLLKIERGLDCGFCCFGWLCPDKLTVSTPNGQVLGSITEKCHLIYPKFRLCDSSQRPILKVSGPAMPCNMGCGPVQFKITTPGGAQIGSINKEWGGIVREMFTDADTFSITFPVNLDPAMKAVCLACLFMIDFEYFEQSHGGGNGRRLFG